MVSEEPSLSSPASLKDSSEPSEEPRPLEPTKTNQSLADTFSLPRETTFIITVCMSQFITQANVGICLSPLDIIGADFGLVNQQGKLSWFLAGYSLTVGTFILVFGRCGDLFGYHRMFIIGFLWLALWSLIAGLSVYSNYILFIFARVLQGLGPAMLLPNGLAILGATYAPGRKKDMVFALFGAMAPNGAIIGAVFAALFSQLAWWPWTYWSMAIVSVVFAGVGFLVIEPIRHERNDDKESGEGVWVALDVPGAVAGITGLVLVNIAWNQAPTVSWGEPYVIVLLIVGVLFLGAFFVIEFRFAKHPLIPFHAFSTDVSFVLACIATGWGCFGTWIFYSWRFLLDIRGVTPLLASAQFAPPGVSGLVAAFVTGYLMSRIRPAWIMCMSLSAFTLGTVLITIAPVDQTYWALTFVSLVVIPWGMDMSFPAATLILSNAVPREHQGLAASLVTTVVNYSISLSLGFAGTIESQITSGETKEERLKGYRGALYFAIGLGGLGMGVSAVYAARSYMKTSRRRGDGDI
ncbi:major facilitator superfamily-domain-containing protein [Aspergillus cavernicola]|uniref:Major facilitator superfamily-domain-containing protein n=1 Tax=Aspergillus cavernicola TaxID=176166 RepID=A0ABR4J0Y0_9EURO